MKRVSWLAMIAVLFLALAVRAGRIADLGIQSDEGAYLVMVEGMLAGSKPYQDLFLNHPPGFFWFMESVFRLMGSDLFVGRWVTQLVSVLTVAALMACVRLGLPTSKRGLSGVLAGLLFALSPLAIFWARFILLEHYETLLATLSIALALLALRYEYGRFWLLSGLLAGFAVIVKISGFILLPVIVVSLLLIYWRAWLKMAKATGLWILGMGMVLVSMVIVLAAQGILDDFGRYLSGADRLAPLLNLPEKMAAFVAWRDGWLLLLFAGVGAVFIVLLRRRILFLGLVWALFELGAVLLPAHLAFSFAGFSHYALPAIAALSLLAGSGVVWGWSQTGGFRNRRWGLVAALLLGLIIVTPNWVPAVDEVARKNNYPGLLADEMVVGDALRAVTKEQEAILVLGNSGFYHWAKRPLSTKFYLLPAYLSESPLRVEANEELTSKLADGSLQALLISRMHLEERLWPELSAVIWQNWEPVALFPYPYQRDVFLFLPKIDTSSDDTGMAVFDNGLQLHQVDAQLLDNHALKVDLQWLPTETIMSEYVVFLHLLDENGNLIAQNDAIPGVGFRPVTTWLPSEIVADRHWLWLPADFSQAGVHLSIGLYRVDNGERLSVLADNSDVTGDAFTIPLNEVD